MIYNSITETIGNTPCIKLGAMAPSGVDLFVKVEAFNPMGSVKDRMAVAIIDDAEQIGQLKPGQTVIEATSGNTGIAMAMVCAARGYPFVATMVETFSVERRAIMRALGAKVILTPGPEKASGMVRAAEDLAEKYGWFLTRQFENEANPNCHRENTGPEIVKDFEKRSLDYFVAGFGTGGTITGVGETLKAARPSIKIVGCEPSAARLLKGGDWAPHKIQGWTPNFIPEVFNTDVVDKSMPVTDDEARDTALRLAREEGIFTGLSGGAAVAVSLNIAQSAKPGTSILAMLPDTGERYLSTYLFEGLSEGSDADNIESWAEKYSGDIPSKKMSFFGAFSKREISCQSMDH